MPERKISKLNREILLGVFFFLGLFSLGYDLHDDHAWRQSIGMMIAHNFHDSGLNLLYPLYDICGGSSPDYYATELPVMSGLIASLYKLFGEHIYLARLVNWIISIIGVYYFSKLVERISGNQNTAFYALVLILGSLYSMFARKVMPDTFSMSLVVIGTYCYDQFLRDRGILSLILGFLFFTLGILSKIPSIVLMGFLIFPYLENAIPLKRKIQVSLTVIFGLGIMYLWYYQWLPHLQANTECAALMFPVSLSEGWSIFLDTYDEVFFRFHINAFQWPLPYYLFLFSAIVIFLKKEWLKCTFLICTSALFLIFILKTGTVFKSHNYYVLPFIPIMAYFIGDFLNLRIRNQAISLLLVAIIFVVGTIKNVEDLSLNAHMHYARIEQILDDSGVHKDDLIMVNGGNMNPVFMYFTRRKGWASNEDVLTKYSWMPDYKNDGLKYMVVDRNIAGKELSLDYELLYRDDDFLVYKP